MKSLPTYINEKLIIKQKIALYTRQELVDAILDHFNNGDGDLNDIDVSKLKEEDFYCLFYNLNYEIRKNNITEINISNWKIKELYYDINKEIGMFEDCNPLETIILPDSLKVIGKFTFYNCEKLDNIIMPESVTLIDQGAFDNCNSLTLVIIPSSVESIGEYAFKSCSSLTSVTIPRSVTSIGDEAFRNCYRLTSMTISDSVTFIGIGAFYNCPKLTITVPNEDIKKLVEDSIFNGKIIIK